LALAPSMIALVKQQNKTSTVVLKIIIGVDDVKKKYNGESVKIIIYIQFHTFPIDDRALKTIK
jgi:hypothetical protein